MVIMNAVSGQPRQRRVASEPGKQRRAAKTRTPPRAGEALQSEPRPPIPGFFQNPDFFRALKKTILRRILKTKPEGEPIRVWVTGAATGEEVYSIAICLLEALGDQSASTPIRLFATDLVEQAIQKARSGTYPETALVRVSPDRLGRFFVREAGSYRVTRVVREACIFACHNLTNDPPFSHLDLIRCRDSLVYLEPMLQKRVLSTFFYALRDTGFLVLGEPETPGAWPDLFKMVDRKNKSFIKRTGVASQAKNKGIKHDEILHLKDELADTREDLQRIIQQYEMINTELSSANEEAVSSMEELQSVNEELASAKDELQSANEELTVLNEQAQKRNLELARLSDDLNNILTGVNIPIVVLGGDGRIRRSTPSAEQLFHLLPIDVGRPMSDIRTGLAVENLGGVITGVLREGHQVESEVQGEDGRWYSLRVRPCWTADAKIDGVLLALLDIHALKETEEAARRKERFVSAILDAAGWTLLVTVFDTEGRIVHFNRSCQVLTGYSLEEAKGRRPWEFLTAPQEGGAFPAWFQHLTPMSTHALQGYWVTKDGRRRLISWWVNVTAGEDGRAQSVILSGIDITERQQARERARQSEATVRALLENAAEAILGVNDAGAVVLTNAAAETMFGYTREEMLDQPLDMLIPARLRPQDLRDWSAFLQELQDRPKGERINKGGVRKNGTEFPVEINLSQVATADGNLAVAFITDVTQRRRYEEDLRRSEAEARASQQQLRLLTARLLEAQEEERRRISRELHDDLNQRLAMLAIEVGSIEAKIPQSDHTTHGRLQSMEKSLKDLSNNVRRTAYQLHPSVLEHLGLVDALETYCGDFSAQEGINVDFRTRKVPAPIPKELALCLYRVAQEALRNIARHSGAARASVTVAGMSGAITLSVKDQGRGFDPSVIGGKRGLGLTSMKERVTAAGGFLTIDSRPDAGTRVQVQIPLARGPE